MYAKIFSYPLLIRESHLDTFGHVNNATYLSVLEEARWEIVTSGGYGMEEIKKSGQGPVILEVNLKFLKELLLRQEVLIKTQMLALEGKISKLKQWIEDKEGNVYAEAVFTFGLFDLNSRKLITPTQPWLAALGMQK